LQSHLQIAAALQAEKLVLMTDVPGVLMDPKDISTKIQELNIRQCRSLIQDGVISGGMIPKVGVGGLCLKSH
jgi:acetylglutamate kinase